MEPVLKGSVSAMLVGMEKIALLKCVPKVVQEMVLARVNLIINVFVKENILGMIAH